MFRLEHAFKVSPETHRAEATEALVQTLQTYEKKNQSASTTWSVNGKKQYHAPTTSSSPPATADRKSITKD
ncbi:MAG TPA: hypothetical protein VFA71_11545 [Terriglobales bacterium]|nr:hypothetical protein [Terriglobales bacterium]